jgi:adenine-specific DNA-methyltransferase
MTSSLALEWSGYFGLAHAPLFENGEVENPDHHAVLLDGGNGSFILSEGEAGSDPRHAASWAWSSALPHHISVAQSEVTVTRWDSPKAAEKFTLRSIRGKLDSFYGYLNQPKSNGRRDVISSLLNLFRSVRGELETASATDDTAVAEFLDVLAHLVSAERPSMDHRGDFSQTWTRVRPIEYRSALSSLQTERLLADFKHQISSLLNVDLSAALAVRHAASSIFQEAHFAFESTNQSDLFGYQPASTSKNITRGAHHFTPPSLARSIVEQALAAISNLKDRKCLVVCDPACGSGAFLTEAVRTLRRIGFNGKLTLVGRDLSSPAVLMARFALNAAKFDWQPEGTIEIDVQVADALDADALPTADLIVMNPPFLAWPMMQKQQRDKVSEILGPVARHRPDLSMSFITRALNAVANGGVVASLIPASVLALDSGKEWRKNLLDRARLAFLGSFGEYGLFVHALVQIAAIVLVVGDTQTKGLAVRSADETTATGTALRMLRRIGGSVVGSAVGKGWRITQIDKRDLLKADRWRILPASVEESLRRLDELGMLCVEDLFDVKQGLLTGLNDVFILSQDQIKALPPAERRFFRPALFRDAITNGTIDEKNHVFFPYKKGGLVFLNESEARAKLPTYFESYLIPRELELKNRSGIDDASKPWWALSRYYAWIQKPGPRLLTKYFGASGDFVLDENARFIPLQGYAWFLKERSNGVAQSSELSTVQVLKAYYTLLNSRTFSRLLKVFSDPVSGGQFNLSARFVRPIPLPDFINLGAADVALRLAVTADATDVLSSRWLNEVDEVSKRVWGEELTSALLEMDDV